MHELLSIQQFGILTAIVCGFCLGAVRGIRRQGLPIAVLALVTAAPLLVGAAEALRAMTTHAHWLEWLVFLALSAILPGAVFITSFSSMLLLVVLPVSIFRRGGRPGR